MKTAAIGGWELLEPIGRGGRSTVWRARRRGGTAEVALQRWDVANPDEGEAVRRELRALERFEHPGLARTFGTGLDDGRPWRAMERVDGPTLRDWARDTWPGDRDPAPALAALLSAFRALCSPLAWLHGEGEPHGDLEASDVLMRGGSEPVIVDFDVRARAARELRGETRGVADDLRSLGRMLHRALGGPTETGGRPAGPVSRPASSVPPAVDALLASLESGSCASALEAGAALADLGARDAYEGRSPRPRARLADVAPPAADAVGEAPIAALVAAALGAREAPAGLVRALRARGVAGPSEALAWLRAAVAIGALERDGRGAWRLAGHTGLPEAPEPYAALALPSGARALAHRRLVALPTAALALAELAAVLGSPFADRWLVSVAPHDPIVTQLLARELRRAGVLASAGAGRTRFADAAVCEVLEEALPRERRRKLHARAARALEREPDVDPAAVAAHWRAAHEPAKAAPWYQAAAAAAESRGDPAEAERLRKLAAEAGRRRAR